MSRGLQWLAVVWSQDHAKNVGRALLERRLALPGSMGQCVVACSVFLLEHPGDVFLPYQEGAGGGFAGTLKTCALTGLHLLAAEGEVGSSGSQTSGSGDMWRQGCPGSPEWMSSCSASETFFGCEVCVSATMIAGPLKSSGMIGQARWWCSFSRIGSMGG